MDTTIKWCGYNLGSSFPSDWRSTSTYDINGNRIETLFHDWDGSTWVITGRGTYTYDSNGNYIEEIRQNWGGSSWVNYWRKALCDYVATIKEQHTTNLFAYPNPVTNYLVVEPEHPSTLTLYNAQGQLLLTKEITTTHTLNTSHLSKGIYFLKATSEKGVYSQKVIKQ